MHLRAVWYLMRAAPYFRRRYYAFGVGGRKEAFVLEDDIFDGGSIILGGGMTRLESGITHSEGGTIRDCNPGISTGFQS